MHEAGGMTNRVGIKSLTASNVEYKILKVSTSGLSCKPQVLYKRDNALRVNNSEPQVYIKFCLLS